MPFSEQFSLSISALITANTPISAYGNATRFVALHTGSPSDDCSLNEISGNGYLRTAVTLSTIEGPTGKMIRNSNIVVFPAATGTIGSQITYFSIWDTQSGGSPIGYGALTTPANWTNGSSLSLAVNALVMTVVNKVV